VSFSPIVAGLLRLPRESNGHVLDDLEQTPFPDPDAADIDTYESWFYCEGSDPTLAISCTKCSEDAHTYTVNIADIPFDTSALLFAVLVNVNGPELLGGRLGCEDEGTVSVNCNGRDDAIYDGTVTGGTWLYPNDTPIAPTYTAEAADPDLPNVCHTKWPDPAWIGGSARLLNPSPTWPVPDGDGNTYGQCLFTLAQLPTAIATTIIRHNHKVTQHGGFSVKVEAYIEGEEDPPAAVKRVWIT
jgi:hypothetical protein